MAEYVLCIIKMVNNPVSEVKYNVFKTIRETIDLFDNKSQTL